MKKSLLAVALLGAFGVASAQSSVTVYGTLDAGLNYSKVESGNSVTALESGQQSYSRLGFKGTEDLGDGLKALFVLEQAVSIDTGNTTDVSAPGSTNGKGLFSSQAYVGLSSNNLGTLKLGRQFTPMYEAHEQIDPFKVGFAANINNFFGEGQAERMSNAVTYTTADNLNGFKASVAYGFGEVAGNTSALSQAGASLAYANGPLLVTYAYHQMKSDVATPTTPEYTAKSNFLGATYDFGVAKAHVAFDQNELNNNSFKTQDYLVGVTVPFGAHAVFADYTHKKDKVNNNADSDQFAVGYTYSLSKRANLYTAYTYVKNDDNSAMTTAGLPSTLVGVDGKSVSTLQVGVRHSF